MDLLTPSFGLIFWTVLAFIVVFYILKKYAWKHIVNSLDEREKNIANSISTAERVMAEMAQLKSENEALLAKAREERAIMLKEAKETKDKIISDAREQAKEQMNNIISDAQVTIEQQKMAAITELKNQLGNLVIEVSEKILRKELSNKDEQQKYIKELTANVKLN